MVITGGAASSFFFNLIVGDVFSSTIGPSEKIKRGIENVLNKKTLNELLDDYHNWFVEIHELEIAFCNDDMLLMKIKRQELLEAYDKSYMDKNFNISTSRKDQFFQESYQIVGKDRPVSELGNEYLNGFLEIVILKKSDKIAPEIMLAINQSLDQVINKLKEQDQNIYKNKKEIEELKKDNTDSADLPTYYDDVLNKFTGPNLERSAALIGKESDEKAYIDEYINVGSGSYLVLDYLEGWFDNKKHGVILIYGEPGHGKSMLCKKATVDYIHGVFLKGKAKNVLTVSLNTSYNPTIIKDGALEIGNALVWGEAREHKFTFEDCRDSLLFMDGLDEFIDTAKTSIRDFDIVSFIECIDRIARAYNIHVVIMSRTVAVEEKLKEKEIYERSFRLLPITETQQDDWLDRHKEFDDYRKTFKVVRKHRNMGELLGIPLLFRLIVYNRFNKVSSNSAELYDDLFDNLMAKRGIRGTKKESALTGLMNLAYKIYCTDTHLAEMGKEDWIFAFYLKVSRTEQGSLRADYKVGFYHRSFYQFFLAKFIYLSLLSMTSENAEEFIGYFAERELDYEVKEYLSLMLKGTDKERIDSKMDIVIGALVKTEAFCNLTPKNDYGNAERSRIGRSTNVYRNVMHIAYALSYVIQIPIKGGLDILIKTFRSDGIGIYSNSIEKANLREANLTRGNLRGADLKGADLKGAYLIGTNLRGAYLIRTDLRGAELSEADLREAHLRRACLSEAHLHGANLRGTDLRGADLRGAELRKADLSEAHLRRACLSEANLREADLRGVDLRGADLRGANLRRACLSKANLREADLRGVDLRGADLRGANLRGAHLSEANLRGADLRGATLDMNISTVNSLKYISIFKKYKTLISSDIDGYDSIYWFEVPVFKHN